MNPHHYPQCIPTSSQDRKRADTTVTASLYLLAFTVRFLILSTNFIKKRSGKLWIFFGEGVTFLPHRAQKTNKKTCCNEERSIVLIKELFVLTHKWVSYVLIFLLTSPEKISYCSHWPSLERLYVEGRVYIRVTWPNQRHCSSHTACVLSSVFHLSSHFLHGM